MRQVNIIDNEWNYSDHKAIQIEIELNEKKGIETQNIKEKFVKRLNWNDKPFKEEYHIISRKNKHEFFDK